MNVNHSHVHMAELALTYLMDITVLALKDTTTLTAKMVTFNELDDIGQCNNFRN